MFTEEQEEELVELLSTLNSSTKIYLGTDSVRYKKRGEWYAKYATVCVIHKNSRHGCKIFKHVSSERDYDLKKDRPSIRLMNEVRKTCDLYVQLAPLIDEFDVEIHVDVNTDPKHGSNCVATQAAGFVRGMTGIEPMLKPDAWAASFSADHAAHNTQLN